MSRQRGRTARRSTLDGVLDVFTLCILIATLFGFLGRLHWFLDLFSHFRVQYVQLSLAPLFIALWRRRYKWAVALVLIVCVNYAFVLPLYLGKPAPATEKPIRAMLMNINAGNGNTRQVIGSIEKFEPDLLLLEEVTPTWARELEVLDSTYPYRVAEPQEGCFGIMLLSKHPLEHVTIVNIGLAGVPSITADIHLPGGVLSFIGTHPLPPIGAAHAGHRNHHLAELPRIVKPQRHPVLLVGDLNTTPFSHGFRRLLHEAHLANSMKGYGYQPSWPSFNRFLRIPLDHVLHSPEIIIHTRMVDGDVGSDHLPVIVDFSVR